MGRGGASLFSKEKLNLFVTLFSQSIYNVRKCVAFCSACFWIAKMPFTAS